MNGAWTGPVKPGSHRNGKTVPIVEHTCDEANCGSNARGRKRPDGWIRVHVAGSALPARWFCCGQCAHRGIAVAELNPVREAS